MARLVDLIETDYAARLRRRHHPLLGSPTISVGLISGGTQPNIVPATAAVWYYFREADYDHIMDMWRIGDNMAKAATLMTDTSFTSRVLGSAWPGHFSRPIAEAEFKDIEKVGLPQWSDADQALAKGLQAEEKSAYRSRKCIPRASEEIEPATPPILGSGL